MDTDRWAKLEELFARAMDRSPQSRSGFLDDECGGDTDLRQRVASLLAHAETGANLTDGVRRAIGVDDPTGPRPGAEVATGGQIGPYRILGELGSGGMGEVWLAEQREPIERKVALKVIKAGMDTRQVVARFEAERQALALMNHPGVAKVYEAGTTPGGRPYFAMQHVSGTPVSEYCDLHRLGVQDRLELFCRICEGVQHAHQKAIIHRDLKPSNILVECIDGRHVPKVIDFGIAKATARKLTDKTLLTEQGVFIGTPEYMSPEQADPAGEDVDTRTDVYSLGVILYELLTGALPFDSEELRRSGVEGVRKRIRQNEPPKPSTRVSTLEGRRSAESASRRGTDPGSLRRALRGDLDWIVMRALAKDRERRYGSPDELAADVRRHLDNEPVLAGPPGLSYRMSKFVRRHRVGVAASAAVLTALLAGFVGVGAMAVVANRERAAAVEAKESAENEAAKASAVTSFLTSTLWRGSPQSGEPADLTVREALDIASEELDSEPPDAPEVEAAIRHTVGVAYRTLGRYEASEAHFRRVIDIHEQTVGPRAHQTVRARHKLATLFLERGEDQAGLEMMTPAIADYRTLIAAAETDEERAAIESDLSDGLNDLGMALTNTGEVREAIATFEELAELDARIRGTQNASYAAGIYNLAILYDTIGEYDEEKRLIDQAFGIYQELFPEETAIYGFFLDSLGLLAQRKGDLETADRHLSRARDIRMEHLGEESTHTAFSIANLARGKHLRGDHAGAEELYRKAIGIQRRNQGDRSRKVAFELHRLGMLEQDMGRLDDAEREYREAISILTDESGELHPHAAPYVHSLGTLQEQLGDHDAAEQSYRRALEIRRSTLPEGNPDINESLLRLGRLLAASGRPEEAEPLLRECWEAESSREPSAYRPPSGSREAYAEVLRDLGRAKEAEALTSSG